jgi:hypothetical protein
MKRDSKSSWEGEQWIVAQEKEGKWRGKNKDTKIVMVKLIIQKKKEKRKKNTRYGNNKILEIQSVC